MEENGCEGNGSLGVFVGFVADVYEEGRGVKGPARRVKGRNSREGREGMGKTSERGRKIRKQSRRGKDECVLDGKGGEGREREGSL